MTDRIEPALTPERWSSVKGGELRAITDSCSDHWGHVETPDLLDVPEIIALANAALHDSDPRKITRGRVNALRSLFDMGCSCGVITNEDDTRWAAAQSLVPLLLSALESYLPPE